MAFVSTGLSDATSAVEVVSVSAVGLAVLGAGASAADGVGLANAFVFPTTPDNIAVGSVTASPFAVRVTTGSGDGTGGFGVSIPNRPRNRGGFGIR